MTKIVNLFGAPGSGKSTAAAGLFALMKQRGVKCELVTEFAKELVYSANFSDLANQWWVTGEQDRRLRRLLGVVDYVITDSPLIMAGVYCAGVWRPYATYGRMQTEEEAGQLHQRIIAEYLREERYLRVPGNDRAPAVILDYLGLGDDA